MTTILSAAICLGVFQGGLTHQYLYKVELLDSAGGLMKPVVRDIEKETATINAFDKTIGDYQIKLKPTFKSDKVTSTRIDFLVFGKGGYADEKSKPKIQALDRFDSKADEIVYYLLKDGIPKRVRTKKPEVHEGELLISIKTNLDNLNQP
ncbi:MAG TPA: hypothetical protein VGL56_16520 [Fimbriimonadaceae bacterium]|jgi:hypothetical protein